MLRRPRSPDDSEFLQKVDSQACVHRSFVPGNNSVARQAKIQAQMLFCGTLSERVDFATTSAVPTILEDPHRKQHLGPNFLKVVGEHAMPPITIMFALPILLGYVEVQ